MNEAEVAAFKETSKYRRRWLTLGVLSTSLLVIALDVTVLNVAIPTLQRELNASASALQWIVNAYVLIFAGLLLTMGSLGDRFGRKLSLQAGLAVFGVASLAAAFADSSGQLIAARAFQGVGGAMIMPSTLSVLVDVFPREERAKAIGIWASVTALGIPGGMILSGYLLEEFFWGSVFLINIPVVVVAMLAGAVLVPESKDPEAKTIDLVGAAISMAALGLLIYTIIEAPAQGWLDPIVLGGFAVSFILGAAFVWYELRIEHPMLDVRYFKNARLSAGAGSIGLAFMAMMAVMFILTQYLQFVRGYTPLETGVRFAPMAIGFMIGGPTSAILTGQFGTKRVLSVGLVLIGVFVGGLALVDQTTAYWVIGLLLVGMGMAMAYAMAPATDAVMAALPESHAGVGSALNDTTRQVGAALGIGVFGSLFNSAYSSNVTNAVVGLPEEAAAAVSNSIGAAIQVAQGLGDGGAALIASSSDAFVESMALTFAAAAVMSLGAAILAYRFMPAHDIVPGEEPAIPEVEPVVEGGLEAEPVPVRIDE